MLSFLDYQIEARKTAIYPSIGGPEVYPALGLANESGEVLGKIKKAWRDGRRSARKGYSQEELAGIKEELGDVLWYLAQLSTELGLDLGELAEGNLAKLRSRQERGTLQGDGDSR